MLKFFLPVISTWSMVVIDWSSAQYVDDFPLPGDVHITEKSYWYECRPNVEGGDLKTCEFTKCITDYNQTLDGPMSCMTPKQLYEFHKAQDTLETLKERNCYEIRKIYPDEYKNAPKSPCIDQSRVKRNSNTKGKPVCNLNGNKRATHEYDYGFYQCEDNDDFILQGCKFENGQCATYDGVQSIVNTYDELKNIVYRIREQRANGETPRTECYELRKHPLLEFIAKVPCESSYELVGDLHDIVDDLEQNVEPTVEDNKETTSTSTVMEITTEKAKAETTTKFIFALLEKDDNPNYVDTDEDIPPSEEEYD